MKYVFVLVLLSGCTRNMCELSIDSLQPAQKIPQKVYVNIDGDMDIDDGGYALLQNYVVMKEQIDAVKQDCSKR